MPPIPIYSKSPINASKASGVTPQTAAIRDEDQQQQAPPPTTTTTTVAGYLPPTRTSPGYPQAQPGAVPSLPVPTGSLAAHGGSAPAPPQPGVAPLAPPPRAGETYQAPAPPEPTAAPQYPPPPQMSIPAPMASLQEQRGGTATATGPPPMGMAALGGSSQPPLGATGAYYHQNPNAAASSPYATAAGQYRPPYGGGGDRAGDRGAGGEEGVWDSAKKYMQAAGSKLSAAETEVWKRINKQ